MDLVTDFRRPGDDPHHAASREILDLDELLAACGVGELAHPQHRREALAVTALLRSRDPRRKGDRGRLECGVARAECLLSELAPDQRCEHAQTCLRAAQFAPNWDFICSAVKKALRKLDLERCCCLRPTGGES